MRATGSRKLDGLTASDGRIYYIAEWTVHGVDVRDPARPDRLGNVDVGWPVHVEGNHAVSIDSVADQEDRCVVRALDEADPAHPIVLDGVEVEGACSEAVVSDNHAYVAAGEALHIVDVSRSQDLAILGRADAFGEAVHVAAGGSLAWVVSERQSPRAIVELAQDSWPF